MSAPSLIRTSVCNVLVALLAAIAVIASESRALAATAIVTTDSGPVEGLVTTAMTEFLGRNVRRANVPARFIHTEKFAL